MKRRILTFILAVAMVFAAAIPLSACGQSQTELYILNWGDYIEPTLVGQFESENPDIKVNMRALTSNEEMYTLIASGDSEIDMVVPSEYMVEKMLKEDMLAQIDLNQIPNFKYVEAFSKQRDYDPESKWSIPYTYGTLGILYNTKMVSDPVTSWNILWDEKYSGKIFMYDSIRDTLGVSLKRLGLSMNSTSKDELDRAANELIKERPLVLAYGTDDLRDAMIGDSGALAVMYSGDAAYCIQQNADLDYAVPEEGSNIFVDNFVILKDSKNKEAAERFINFMLDPKVSAKNTEYIGYSTPNVEALKQIDQSLLDNHAFNITQDQIERCEYYTDLGDFIEYYNDVWMKVKTS